MAVSWPLKSNHSLDKNTEKIVYNWNVTFIWFKNLYKWKNRDRKNGLIYMEIISGYKPWKFIYSNYNKKKEIW